MDDQKPGFDKKFEEDPYPRKPYDDGKRTDARIAQEQAEGLDELGAIARSRTLKYLTDADELDDYPAVQEKKISMACKLGGLYAKLVATSGHHNKARRGY